MSFIDDFVSWVFALALLLFLNILIFIGILFLIDFFQKTPPPK